jgi:hypothetical protein
MAFALMFGAGDVRLSAQESSKPPRAFAIPRSILLPPKLVAGAQATLAVLDSQGRLLPDIAVELSGNRKVTTDITGRALFNAPDQPGNFVARVSAKGVSASSVVLPAATVAAQVNSQPEPKARVTVTSTPHFVAIHDRFTLEGSGFRGAADSNHVFLNGDPCVIAAASPLAMVILPGPRIPVGNVDLRVNVGGVELGPFPVLAVLLDFSGPPDSVTAGATGKLIVRAHGTTEPLLLEVRNVSPSVIKLSKGNVQRVKSSGGEENIAEVEMKFIGGGNYVVSARLLSADASVPNLELARKRLTEAKTIATRDWSSRIDQVLREMDQAPQDLLQIRAQLKSMLDDKPVGPLASLLDSAWRELN